MFRIVAFIALLSPAAPLLAQSLSPVTVVMPDAASVADRLQLTGTLSAEHGARLSPRVDGLVARVRVDAGDVVRAGEPLLELDATLARLALERSRADSSNAQVRADEAARLVAEAQRLAEQRHVSATEIAAREAALAQAEAERNAARVAEREQAELVERHILPAPFDGVIVRRMTEAGEWVTRGTPVLELVAIDRVRLDVQAPQERYADISEDATVTVRPDASPGLALPARVAARVPVAGDASARSFLVRILIDDAEHRLLPGTSATADIRLRAAARAGVLRVPRDALLRQPDGGHHVFSLEGEQEPVARRHSVRIGRQADGMVEILDGLPAGRPVVVRGNEALRDGQRVRVVSD